MPTPIIRFSEKDSAIYTDLVNDNLYKINIHTVNEFQPVINALITTAAFMNSHESLEQLNPYMDLNNLSESIKQDIRENLIELYNNPDMYVAEEYYDDFRSIIVKRTLAVAETFKKMSLKEKQQYIQIQQDHKEFQKKSSEHVKQLAENRGEQPAEHTTGEPETYEEYMEREEAEEEALLELLEENESFINELSCTIEEFKEIPSIIRDKILAHQEELLYLIPDYIDLDIFIRLHPDEQDEIIKRYLELIDLIPNVFSSMDTYLELSLMNRKEIIINESATWYLLETAPSYQEEFLKLPEDNKIEFLKEIKGIINLISQGKTLEEIMRLSPDDRAALLMGERVLRNIRINRLLAEIPSITREDFEEKVYIKLELAILHHKDNFKKLIPNVLSLDKLACEFPTDLNVAIVSDNSIVNTLVEHCDHPDLKEFLSRQYNSGKQCETDFYKIINKLQAQDNPSASKRPRI